MGVQAFCQEPEVPGTDHLIVQNPSEPALLAVGKRLGGCEVVEPVEGVDDHVIEVSLQEVPVPGAEVLEVQEDHRERVPEAFHALDLRYHHAVEPGVVPISDVQERVQHREVDGLAEAARSAEQVCYEAAVGHDAVYQH